MSNLRTFKIVALVLEAILAVPLIGGTIVIGSGYFALGLMFVIHLIILVLAAKTYTSKTAAIAGLITSAIAWIPVLGWVLHCVTAILYAIEVIANRD
ncbi:hypothetical protein [Paenisporosarcina cavernae]|uniref:Uncharacterized protein n=1 Tax=Paenisporosarcina cavernae TaxID=2320858 RepID=A0A385YT88_9BACL|nr:hypothetical protein [Paenisporosarcina cavernae]AYC28898.1 hypothetical protein D3873_03065 [Paenisporosarcina cavernae]